MQDGQFEDLLAEATHTLSKPELKWLFDRKTALAEVPVTADLGPSTACMESSTGSGGSR